MENGEGLAVGGGAGFGDYEFLAVQAFVVDIFDSAAHGYVDLNGLNK